MRSSSSTQDLYVGLMSGTSMDGIDAALLRFGNRSCEIIAGRSHRYPGALRAELLGASRDPRACPVDTLGSLDNRVGHCFAQATGELLESANVDINSIVAIGSHGQTIRHQPLARHPFTLQIGDPNIIATQTGITTVADFRRRDMSLGGEGAPLAPAFHQWMFGASQHATVVLNIGGIANVTVLSADPNDTIGFDTGPGNTLLDAWIQQTKSQAFDKDGEWARSGKINQPLLERMLTDQYLSMVPPKSTGFEYFNLHWLQQAIDDSCGQNSVLEQDVQATLAEFTVRTIVAAIQAHAPATKRVLVCGGGVHNKYLMQRLESAATGVEIFSSAERGLDPDWMEAAAFAWLAMRTLSGQAGNLPSVTGADGPAVLGGVFFAAPTVAPN